MKKTYPTRPLSLDYLIEEYSILFETPSYPGGESALAEIIKCILSRLVDADFTTDLNGNLVARINPSVPLSLILEAHIDRVAAGVCNVGIDGRIYTHPIGRLEINRYFGNSIYIIDKNGNKTPAIVGGNTKMPGITSACESVWLDTGNRHGDVRAGDIAQFFNGPKALGTHLAGAGLDNLIGVICLIEAAKNICRNDIGLALWFSSKEEISATVLPEFDLCCKALFISVDTCFSSDCIDTPVNSLGSQHLSGGPIVLYDPHCSRDFNERIIELASGHNIRHQKYLNISPGHGLTVTNPALAPLKAMRSCLLLPVRYMHSPQEVCSVQDMNDLIALLNIIAHEI